MKFRVRERLAALSIHVTSSHLMPCNFDIGRINGNDDEVTVYYDIITSLFSIFISVKSDSGQNHCCILCYKFDSFFQLIFLYY